MSAIEFRNVSKVFPNKGGSTMAAVEDVSFRAEEGEFLALLGPSGCGKTTLLRILAGLETATSGDVFIGDRRVNDVPASKRRIAMVFQNYALYPHLSARENILFGLKVRRVPKAEQEKRLATSAEMLGLVDYLDRRPSELSGGQRQRVALGRAVVSRAEVILMDEPLSNLDAKLRNQMRTELRDLQQELGITVVYVTHDQIEAMTMADRVVVMRKGAVEQVDEPIELYSEPASVTVAGFIGSPPMNLFLGTFDGRDVVVETQGLALPVSLPLPPSTAVRIGIRAEHLTLATGDGRLRGAVTGVEHLGADTVVTVDAGLDAPIVARLFGQVRIAPGASVGLDFATSEARFFDETTGRRVLPDAVAASVPETVR